MNTQEIINSVPEGYVYLGLQSDINVPNNWRTGSDGSHEYLDFAFFWNNTWHKENGGWINTNSIHIAAKPGSKLYQMNQSLDIHKEIVTLCEKINRAESNKIAALEKENKELRAKLDSLKKLFDTL